jgi:hypothetical protein
VVASETSRIEKRANEKRYRATRNTASSRIFIMALIAHCFVKAL